MAKKAPRTVSAPRDLINAHVKESSDVPRSGLNVVTSKKRKRIKYFFLFFIGVIISSTGTLEAAHLYHVYTAKQKTTTTIQHIQAGPQTLDEQQLRNLVVSKGLTVYWLGAKAGATYILDTSLANGISLRAINSSDPVQTFYEVGTYISQNAFATMQRAALQPHGVGYIDVDGNAIYYDSRDLNNVYIGLRGSNIEVEIYDPRPGAALAAALLQGNLQKIV